MQKIRQSIIKLFSFQIKIDGQNYVPKERAQIPSIVLFVIDRHSYLFGDSRYISFTIDYVCIELYIFFKEIKKQTTSNSGALNIQTCLDRLQFRYLDQLIKRCSLLSSIRVSYLVFELLSSIRVLTIQYLLRVCEYYILQCTFLYIPICLIYIFIKLKILYEPISFLVQNLKLKKFYILVI